MKLRRYLLCGCVAACHGMACMLHAVLNDQHATHTSQNFTWKDIGKIVTKLLCTNFVTILPVFFHVNFLESQNVHCHVMYLCYGVSNSLMMTP